LDLPPTYWPSSNGKDESWVREHYAPPSKFIEEHRKLFVPQKEKTLVLVSQESYKMRLYKNGQTDGDLEISLGQGTGVKQIEGDNKTPKGMYFVTNKHRGNFDGEYGEYYGGHWIKINYPNKYDAERGIANGQISPEQASSIASRWKERASTLENTKLGGGIGFHGWISEWDNDETRHRSWGCVVMHLYDITRVFDKIPEGTMVVIL
jgi:murein L,D-transpeptidase YafK